MKHLFAALVGVGLALAGPSAAEAKDWQTVTIATEGAYEPWNLTKPDGTLDGFEIDLGKDLCARMHLTCTFVAQSWDGMIAGLNAGKFDILMDGIAITDDRSKVVDFSKPYASTPGGFAGLKDGPLATMPGTGTQVVLTGDKAHDKPVIDAFRAALKGKRIGIQASTSFTKFVEDNFGDVAEVVEYKTAPEHDLDVTAGRVDVAFDDVTYFVSAFSKPENSDMMLVGPKIAGPIWGPGEAAAFRKSDPELRAKFDEALAAALADGTVKTLSLKWFKLDVTPVGG